MICWIDIETTGLDQKIGSVLEIAIVTTDDNLNEIGDPYVSLVKPLHMRGIEVMDDFVQKMHGSSGLLDEIYLRSLDVEGGGPAKCVLRDGLISPGGIERAAMEHVLKIVEDAKQLKETPIAGSSIHFDRAWLSEHMDDFVKPFSHRMVDVSSYTEMAKRWAPGIYGNRPGLGPDGKPIRIHRALEDIRSSIATLRYYRENKFICG